MVAKSCGFVALVSMNLVLLRRVLAPLEHLTEVMSSIDPDVPGTRLADDEPMALKFSTIAGYCLSSVDAVEDSLYAALEKVGNRPVRALQRLRAVPFGAEHARMLGVDPGHAGLLIERRAFLRDGRPAEVTRSYYRGDAYDFVAELSDI